MQSECVVVHSAMAKQLTMFLFRSIRKTNSSVGVPCQRSFSSDDGLVRKVPKSPIKHPKKIDKEVEYVRERRRRGLKVEKPYSKEDGTPYQLYHLISKMDRSADARPLLATWEKWYPKYRRKKNFEQAVIKLRDYGRYKHALEVSDFMEEHVNMCLGKKDYTLRLELIARVRGIGPAEKYFKQLPDDAKRFKLYTALLESYVREGMIGLAEKLIEKMKEVKAVRNAVPHNTIMHFYLKSGQPEKVPPLIQDMKETGVIPNTLTYSFWMKSVAALSGVHEVDTVLNELKQDGYNQEDWRIYNTLASLYIDAGESVKAHAALENMERSIDRNSILNHLSLVQLYSSLDNLEKVRHVWKLIRLRFKSKTNNGYYCLITALIKLGDVKGAEKCFDEWLQDKRFNLFYEAHRLKVPNMLLEVYIREGKIDKADALVKQLIDKGVTPNSQTWYTFAIGCVDNNQMELAFESMKKAFSKPMGSDWNPESEKVLSVLKYIEDLDDVDKAEEMFRSMRCADYVNTDTYNSLLRTYINSNKSPGLIVKRMKFDKIEFDAETERLLKSIESADASVHQ